MQKKKKKLNGFVKVNTKKLWNIYLIKNVCT